MTSKELLEQYYDYIPSQILDEIIKITKPYFDRLEQFEKENKEMEKLVWKKVKELVNEEHRSKQLYDKNIELKQENTKLKKALEILKEKKVSTTLLWNSADVDDHNLYQQDRYCLTQEEYELLKGVLE